MWEYGNDYLAHHGIKGQKWGVRRTPEQLGHHSRFKPSTGGTYTSSDTVFVSGKVKFDEPLPEIIRNELNRAVSANSKIIIGDAPGADTRVQDHLSQIGYKNVTVYTTDKKVRNNVGDWPVKTISGNGNTDERLIRRQKDIAMTNSSTKGIVISSDDDRNDSATALNVQRMDQQKKTIQFYDYKANELRSNESVKELKHRGVDMWEYGNDYLAHHGIKGQKWGVRRFQNPDGTRTALGKKHEKSTSGESHDRPKMSSSTKKKIAVGAVMGLTVAAAAVAYSKNPAVRNAVNGAVAKAGKTTVSALKKAPSKAVDLGKAYVKSTVAGIKEGVKEGVKEAPKTAAKAIVTGITLNAAKRIMDDAVGKEEAARIFKANNRKKIDSFWNITNPDDKDD